MWRADAPAAIVLPPCDTSVATQALGGGDRGVSRGSGRHTAGHDGGQAGHGLAAAGTDGGAEADELGGGGGSRSRSQCVDTYARLFYGRHVDGPGRLVGQ